MYNVIKTCSKYRQTWKQISYIITIEPNYFANLVWYVY